MLVERPLGVAVSYRRILTFCTKLLAVMSIIRVVMKLVVFLFGVRKKYVRPVLKQVGHRLKFVREFFQEVFTDTDIKKNRVSF